jgi:hypothetical protein
MRLANRNPFMCSLIDVQVDEGGVPVARPTSEQFRSFKQVIEKIDGLGKSTGLVKIVPPSDWVGAGPFKDRLAGLKIKHPIEQTFCSGHLPSGAYRQMHIEKKRSYTVEEWQRFCDANAPPAQTSLARNRNRESTSSMSNHETTPFTPDYCRDLERLYWRSLTFSSPCYGADVEGSLFEKDDTDPWNIGKLDNLLNTLTIPVPGVNKPYLYWGMWKASFAWHVVRIHSWFHCDRKTWISIPSSIR